MQDACRFFVGAGLFTDLDNARGVVHSAIRRIPEFTRVTSGVYELVKTLEQLPATGTQGRNPYARPVPLRVSTVSVA